MHNPYKSDSLIKAVGQCPLLNASVPMKAVIIPLTEVISALDLVPVNHVSQCLPGKLRWYEWKTYASGAHFAKRMRGYTQECIAGILRVPAGLAPQSS